MPYLLFREEPAPEPIESPDNLVPGIECYALPYGGIGVLSHLLTFYTLIVLWCGRAPLLPFRRLRNGSKFILARDLISTPLAAAMAIRTVINCKNAGATEFMLVAIWKLVLTLLYGITSVHVAGVIIAERVDKAPTSVTMERLRRIPRWFLFHIFAMCAGMAGVVRLVLDNFQIDAVKSVTIAFYILAFVVLFVMWVFDLGPRGVVPEGQAQTPQARDKRSGARREVPRVMPRRYWTRRLFIAVGCIAALAAFYSDVILGAMMGNWAGIPTKDNVPFYWAFFIAKRLTMIAW